MNLIISVAISSWPGILAIIFGLLLILLSLRSLLTPAGIFLHLFHYFLLLHLCAPTYPENTQPSFHDIILIHMYVSSFVLNIAVSFWIFHHNIFVRAYFRNSLVIFFNLVKCLLLSLNISSFQRAIFLPGLFLLLHYFIHLYYPSLSFSIKKSLLLLFHSFFGC